MFTQKCFIRKNTKELVNKLSNVGYNILFSARYGYGKYLVFANNFICGQDRIPTKDYIDCGNNEDLFLAIAALRDDSNEHQWFVWDDDENEGDKWKLYDNNPNWSWWIFECHKATVEELIEHFKK